MAESLVKHVRLAYMTSQLSSEVIVQMRVLHSQGLYRHLEQRTLHIFPDWRSNKPYEFLSESDDSVEYIEDLTNTALSSQMLVNVLKLIVLLSQEKNSAQNNEPVAGSLVPILGANRTPKLGHKENTVEIMMLAAKRAHSYIVTFDQSPALARLRLILSYITLYLTVEFGITSRIRLENPELGQKAIAGRKWTLFYKDLGGAEGLGCSLDRLKDTVAFGKILWTWAKECGIMWLPVLAAMEYGVTGFTRKNALKYRRSFVVGSKLSMHASWLALCRGFSSLFTNLLFSPTSAEYTLTDLTQIYLCQANGSFVAGKFQRALCHNGLKTPIFTTPWDFPSCLRIEEATQGTIFEALNIDIPLLPSTGIPKSLRKEINLIDWVLNAESNSVVQLKTTRGEAGVPTLLHVRDLGCLFGPMEITQQVFGFICQCFDYAGLQLWLILSIEEGSSFMSLKNQRSVEEALAVVLQSETSYIGIRFLLIPVETEASYFIYLCEIESREITIFYWETLPNSSDYLKELIEVSSLLPY